MSIRFAAAATAVLSIIASGAELRIRTTRFEGSRHSSTSGRLHGVMTPEQARERGGRILTILPGGNVVASVSLREATGIELFQPGSKLSAAIEFEDSELYFLVSFHQDVEHSTAERILLETGIPRIEHPDLVPGQWLVRASEEQIRALTEFDEVAYIFPASEELAAGAPVRGCIGPLVDETVVAQYVSTVGHGWDGDGKGSAQLKYALGHVTAQLPAESVAEAVRRALAEWSRNASIQFQGSADTTGSRTLTIVFAAGRHGDSYPFDGKGGVLGHTFYPAGINPEPIAGDIHLDEEETWTMGAQPDLYSVLLHEIGHALGLGHSDRPGAVMYPYYRLLTTLQADDVSALQRIYSAPTVQAPPDPVAPTTPTPDPTPTTPTTPPQTPPSTGPGVRDNAAPSLSITRPSSSSYSTSAASLRISGTAKDNVGVTQVVWQRGSDAGVASGTATWSFDLPLLVGTNNIVVRAKDAAGNTGWRSVVITRR